MAAVHGKQGSVTFATVAMTSVLSWSIDASCGTADASIMDSSAVTAATHWKDHVAGFKRWTATVECLLDDGGVDPDLTTDFGDVDGAALVLFTERTGGGGRKYSGTAFVTGIAPSADKDDIEKVTYTFQGSSTLSVAAA
jgi:hypothetical protein